MAKQAGYTSFRDAIGALLDKHEKRPDSTNLFVPVAGERQFSSVHEVDQFKRQVEALALAGAIEIRRLPKTGPNGPLKKIKLLDPHPIYGLLERSPITKQVDHTVDSLLASDHGIPEDLLGLVSAAKANWSRGGSWLGIPVNDTETLMRIVNLVDGIRQSIQGDGMDMRTFSRRVCGDSKSLEKNRSIVLRILDQIGFEYEKADSPEETLRVLGIEKFLQPVTLAGPIRINGMPIGGALPYLGIPGGSVERIDIPFLKQHVRAVLTIENFASFNRQVTEAMEPSVLTIYTGGFPSRSVTRFLKLLGRELPSEVEFLHWGDIDMPGARIADFVWRTVARPMRLHLMDPIVAENFGTQAPAENIPSFSRTSPALTLAKYLSGESGAVYTLEQEELEPGKIL